MVINLFWMALACGGGDKPADPGTDGATETTDPTDGTTDGTTDTTDAGPSWQDDVVLAEMAPVDLLTRVSLDLRGVRPDEADIARVESDASAVDDLALAYMESERFSERVVQIFSEIYLTRLDAFTLSADAFGMDDVPGFNDAVGQEPLRILAHVAASDLPWTETVTADYTVANALLVDAWELEYTGDGAGEWRPAIYPDSRPASGVLATNGLWWRYSTTASNANRGRANQISRILLCNDYLTREIAFDRNTDLLDEEAINDAIATNPACVNCHNSLDPLAAYLYGFWVYNDQSYLEMSTYHPERERLYDDYLGVSPSFYGEPGDNLTDLGQQIAGDVRFPACVVEQVYGALLDRTVDSGDMNPLTGHREAFLDSGLLLKALMASVIADTRYRAVDSSDPDVDAVDAPTAKMVSPDQLSSQVEALTGFRWTYADYDMLATDQIGLRTLAGGADGRAVIKNAQSPNATLVLVQQRLAEAAASHAVAAEIEQVAGQRALFTEVDFTETDPDALAPQLQRLHLLVLGDRVDLDGEEVAAGLDLWAELHAIDDDPAAAWTGLLTALLRDPDFLFY